MENITNNENTFKYDANIYDKKIKKVKPPDMEIGVDTKEVLIDNIIDAGLANNIDISAIDKFTQMATRRDQVYSFIDDMGRDSLISAALEIYTEDTTAASENGRIVWCNSEDNNIRDMVTFLLDSMNVDKNIYKWAYCLIKYGDVYLRLYRQSEEDDAIFYNNKEKKQLNEDVKVKAFAKNDNYTHYVEMVKNPAEMFELTKFGKTYGYIKAPIQVMTSGLNADMNSYMNGYGNYSYSFKKQDIDIYPATEFVHASLEESSDRVDETVNIFISSGDNNEDVEEKKYSYSVKRGQSILYNSYKIWRELSLLESSVLLNRVTKSSVLRIIGVEVGDMPKEQVQMQLNKVKRLIEQKTAINNNVNMSEYTNPGPVENSVYIPTHGGQGALTVTTMGGDVNIGELTDLDYYKKKLQANLKVPGPFLGDTDDNTGFNGGTSLTIISSRYAKTIIKIQNAIVQAITDAVNLMLLDKGLDNYINKFTIMINPPVTQEDIDRKEALTNRISIVNDVMNIIDGQVNDELAKLKIMKSLLSDVLVDSEVPYILEDEIKKLENESEQSEIDTQNPEDDDRDINVNISNRESRPSFEREQSGEEEVEIENEPEQIENEPEQVEEIPQPEQGEEILPTPDSLDIDLT